MLEATLKDLQYGWRSLLKSPGFALTAVLSLGLGIGVNTTIFSVVNAVLLRPLPVERPNELVALFTSGEAGATEFSSTSFPDYRDLRELNTVFSDVAGHSLMFANLNRDGKSRIVIGEVVTGNYFGVLGVKPVLGRTFTDEEDRTELTHPVTVLGYGFWKRQFGTDPGILGKTLRLNGASYTIVGVAPESFTGLVPGFAAELFVPAMMVEKVEPAGIQDVVPSPTGRTRLEQRGRRWLFLKGRLKPGVPLAQAQANASAIMARLESQYPETNRGRNAKLLPASGVRLHPLLDSALSPAAVVLMAVVLMVLLIACANVANLLLARASTRRREIAVRLALGASRARLLRQLLSESLLLSVLGAALGLVLAYWTTGAILAFQPPVPVSLSIDLGIDFRVLVFTMVVAAVAALAFGLAPALQSTQPSLVPALKNETVPTARRRRVGLRQALVVSQVTISSILLVGAALLARGLANARSTNLGFEPAGLSIFATDLGMHGYSQARGEAFYRDAVERVSALPGVQAVGLAERLPFGINIFENQIFIEGRQAGPSTAGFTVDETRVGAKYFDALGVPILRGRDFEPSDTPGPPRVAIINEAMAKGFWPGEDAVGKRFRVQSVTGPEIEIVGVSADHKVRTVGEEPRPFVHFARSQRYGHYCSLLVRSRGDQNAVFNAVRREMLAMEPELAFLESQTMEDDVAVTLFPARAGAALLAGFGALALGLAAVGLYGVIAYSVSRRTREIGIRMALGARPQSVARLVVKEGMSLVGFGLFAGLLVASVAGRALSSLLYGVSALDPAAFGAAALLLAAVAFLANWIPARRAARVDPMVALREL